MNTSCVGIEFPFVCIKKYVEVNARNGNVDVAGIVVAILLTGIGIKVKTEIIKITYI